MQTVLVTGHRGLLGSTLCRVLSEAGYVVRLFEGDIVNPSAWQTAISSLETLDLIIHTAAATDVNRCEREPEWCTRVNVEGTRQARDAAAAHGARFLHLSTASVFSGELGNYSERDIPEPRNCYNISKHASEQIVAEYERGLILRTNLIGVHPKGSRGKNFMEWLVDAVHGNQDIQLFTDIRINPLSNWTLAELITHLVGCWPRARVLHLGSRTVLSKADIGRRVIADTPSYTGTVHYVQSDPMRTAAFRPKEMWLNVDEAERFFGFSLPTLEEEVKRILQNFHP